jgi:hypothetical protein
MNANGKMLVVLFALLAVASLGIWLFLSEPHRAELCSRDDLVYAPSVAGDGSLTDSGDQQSSASGQKGDRQSACSSTQGGKYPSTQIPKYQRRLANSLSPIF